MKLASDDGDKVKKMHLEMCSDTHTRSGTAHIKMLIIGWCNHKSKCFQMFLQRRVHCTNILGGGDTAHTLFPLIFLSASPLGLFHKQDLFCSMSLFSLSSLHCYFSSFSFPDKPIRFGKQPSPPSISHALLCSPL